jgi:hypothetical protein
MHKGASVTRKRYVAITSIVRAKRVPQELKARIRLIFMNADFVNTLFTVKGRS